MDYTRQVGSIVSLDVNVRPMLWASPTSIRGTIAQGVERADILKLSIDESEFVSEPGSSSIGLDRLAESLLERGPRLVIITTGANGALLQTATQRVEVRQLPVRPVDTTGAGDAFIGAVLYKLVQQGCATPSDLQELTERDLSDLGSFANQVAGLSVTRYGGIPSFPLLHEISGLSAT
jgi:fructokinase